MFNRSSLGLSISTGMLVSAASLLMIYLFQSPAPFVLSLGVIVIFGAILARGESTFRARFRLAFGATAVLCLTNAIFLMVVRPMWNSPTWVFFWHFGAALFFAVLLAIVSAAMSTR